MHIIEHISEKHVITELWVIYFNYFLHSWPISAKTMQGLESVLLTNRFEDKVHKVSQI